MKDQIHVTESDGRVSADIDGIPACGTGATVGDAIRSLANLLGDFVKGHAKTIDNQRSMMRNHARSLLEWADPSPPQETCTGDRNFVQGKKENRADDIRGHGTVMANHKAAAEYLARPDVVSPYRDDPDPRGI